MNKAYFFLRLPMDPAASQTRSLFKHGRVRVADRLGFLTLLVRSCCTNVSTCGGLSPVEVFLEYISSKCSRHSTEMPTTARAGG